MGYEPGHRIFEPNTWASGAIFVYWGTLEYCPMATIDALAHPGTSMPGRSRGAMSQISGSGSQKVTKGACICELALWIEWKYHGHLEAVQPCELLTLSTVAWLQVLRDYPLSFSLAQDYATCLCKASSEAALSDLKMPVAHEVLL